MGLALASFAAEAHLGGSNNTLLWQSHVPCADRPHGTNESCALSCLEPGCKWCGDRSFLNRTAHQAAACSACECRACWICQRDAVPPGSCESSGALIVLLRGEAYRAGKHAERRHFSDSVASIRTQRAALASLRRHVLEPALTVGWKPEVVAELDTSNALASQIVADVHEELAPYVSELRVQREQSTQMKSLLAIFEYALRAASLPPSRWHAVRPAIPTKLLLRACPCPCQYVL